MKISALNRCLSSSSLISEPISTRAQRQAVVPADAIWKQSLDDPEETQAFARLVRRAVEYIAPRRVLDVGCGSGSPTIEAAHAGAPRVLGIDLVPRNVFIARRNIREASLDARVTAHLAAWQDVLAGDFYPGEVDLVVSNPPYVPSGDGSAVDGGLKGTRMLLSLIDGLPRSARGVALLLGSFSDPLHVLARIEQRGYRISHLFAESVPFGRYTSAPHTLAALKRLRAQGSAWFFDSKARGEARTDALLAPHAYLRLGVIAEREERPDHQGVTSLLCPRAVPPAEHALGRATEEETQRAVARLLESYQRGGPSTLAEFSLIDRL